MNREEFLSNEEQQLYRQLKQLNESLNNAFSTQFKRSLPYADALFDRWKRAEQLGFGLDTSIYNSSIVFGNPTVGKNCWIGPGTIIDGSGGLTIGDNCTISVGVQIYTHDSVLSTLTAREAPIERAPVKIGDNTYIGPNVVISKGIHIGSYCVIGANSIVTKNIEDFTLAYGQPAIVKGDTRIKYDLFI